MIPVIDIIEIYFKRNMPINKAARPLSFYQSQNAKDSKKKKKTNKQTNQPTNQQTNN